ncbi:MAG: acetyl ornithine aminotransferase family protein [Pirellulaceae bacterium]
MPKELASSPPLITTKLPGPNSARLIAEDERYTSPSYTRVYPLVVRRAQGAMIEDMDGNRFLDFTAGIAVCATGHCHPRVVQAIRVQSERLLHMSGTDFYYQPQSDLARKLVQITPGNGPKRVFFTNSGAESVEAAFKLARYHTRRPHVIAFFGAFHGRTMGALSLTGSKTRQRAGFAPLVPEVSHVDFPDCYQCPRRTTNDSCCWKTFEQIEDDLFRRTVSPDEVAAFFVEPIQGEGGYIVPPHDFHVRLKRLAEQHGILFIADEVQSGMGRTGRMFAMEHWGVEPDIMCLAKGIASGMPLGAIVAKEEVMNWPPGSHASTFGGNPISCVAALKTIQLLEDGLIQDAADVGAYLRQRLLDLMPRYEMLGDVRGLGLMVGVEIVADRVSRKRAPEKAKSIVQAAFRRGLLLLTCGENTLRFCPPLVVSRDQVDMGINILEEVLRSEV